MAYCVLSWKLLDVVGKPLAKATFKFTSSSNSTSIINAVDTIVTTAGITSYGASFVIAPASDNTAPVCTASRRASTIYLGTSPQVTSDANAKMEIGPIPPEALAAWADVEWVRYKLKDGSSNRWHTGLIAQQVVAAFAAHGLDAKEYGIVCWEEWEEEAVLAEDGVTVITPAKTTGAWSVRYDEAFAFEAAYQRSK